MIRKTFFVFVCATLLVAILGQSTSEIVRAHLHRGETLTVAPLLYLAYAENTGAAFGLLAGHVTTFALVAGIVILSVAAYCWHRRDLQAFQGLYLGCVAGGGMSNVLEVATHGVVTDFIRIQGIPFWHYTFNVADIFIFSAVCLFVRSWPRPAVGLLRRDA